MSDVTFDMVKVCKSAKCRACVSVVNTVRMTHALVVAWWKSGDLIKIRGFLFNYGDDVARSTLRGLSLHKRKKVKAPLTADRYGRSLWPLDMSGRQGSFMEKANGATVRMIMAYSLYCLTQGDWLYSRWFNNWRHARWNGGCREGDLAAFSCGFWQAMARFTRQGDFWKNFVSVW